MMNRKYRWALVAAVVFSIAGVFGLSAMGNRASTESSLTTVIAELEGEADHLADLVEVRRTDAYRKLKRDGNRSMYREMLLMESNCAAQVAGLCLLIDSGVSGIALANDLSVLWRNSESTLHLRASVVLEIITSLDREQQRTLLDSLRIDPPDSVPTIDRYDEIVSRGVDDLVCLEWLLDNQDVSLGVLAVTVRDVPCADVTDAVCRELGNKVAKLVRRLFAAGGVYRAAALRVETSRDIEGSTEAAMAALEAADTPPAFVIRIAEVYGDRIGGKDLDVSDERQALINMGLDTHRLRENITTPDGRTPIASDDDPMQQR